MTLTWDISTDFEDVTDALETVTYAPRLPAEVTAAESLTRYAGQVENYTPDTESLTKCLRRNVSTTEAAASDGKLLAGDTRWHLSINELATQPSLGSTLTDAAGDVYTILEVRKDTLSSRWRCVTRNLRVVHNLSQLATIQTRTIAVGDAGAAEDTWATRQEQVPCRLEPVSVDSEVVNGVRRATGRWLLYLAADVSLDASHRIVVGGTNYEYIGHSDTERLDMMQVAEIRDWRRG